MIESVEEGTVIGMVDLVDFNPRHMRAEVGIVLGRDYRNRGYGTEVLALLENIADAWRQIGPNYQPD